MKNEFVITAFAALLLLTACNGDRRYDIILDTADSLMESRPDSALRLLEKSRNKPEGMNKRQYMRLLLLTAKAQNKAYLPMISEKKFQSVADYYDRNGTSNEKMLAHYLMGCIYRDRNDAPKTIECFQQAIDCADTLDRGCDHSTLMRIYGQMANIFFLQKLPEEEINALENARRHAILSGDTVSYIKGLELLVRPYYEMDDAMAVIDVTQKAHDLYLKHGLHQEAAASYPSAIFVFLQQGNYTQAHVMMEEFEKYSGLFTNGEIEAERRQYYYSKGLYFQGINQPDSAEFYYRKLNANGFHLEASRGLMMLYCDKHDADSVKKYTLLYEKYVEQMEKKSQTDAVLKMQALYDYSRSKQLAEKQRKKSEILERTLFFFVTIAFFTIILVYLAYRNYRNKKDKHIRRLTNDYQNIREKLMEQHEEIDILLEARQSLQKARNEILFLTDHAKGLLGDTQGNNGQDNTSNISDAIKVCKDCIDEIIENRDEQLERKQEKINNLTIQLENYEEQLGIKEEDDREKLLLDSQIVNTFKKKSKKTQNRTPTEYEWKGLQKAFRIYMPDFIDYLESYNNLTLLEQQVALLVRLGFTNGAIANLLDKTSQHVTNLKSTVNKKIFGDNQTRKLLYNLKRLSRP